MTRRSARGFTLLELLVVIAIFAVMSVLAYGGLRNFLTGRSVAASQGARLAALETAFVFLQQDVEAALPRPIRDQLGGAEPAFRGGEGAPALLQLTRRGANPRPQSGRADLRRIEYRLAEGRLVRRVWPMLDRPQDAKPEDEVLVEGVDAASVRFYAGNWLPFWPAAGDSADSAQLPRALGVRLRFHEGREIERLFLLPAGGGT